MWKLYSTSNQSVAVQSTYTRLHDGVTLEVPRRLSAHIGVVHYIDYEHDVIPGVGANGMATFVYKRKSFEHERELRIAFWDGVKYSEKLLAQGGPPVTEPGEPGVRLDIDLLKVVERVLVAPTAQSWFLELVQRVTETYGMKWPVEKSALDAPAIF
jgi:hypothetical protein